MVDRNLDESEFGPYIDFREHGFLDHPLVDIETVNSRVNIFKCRSITDCPANELVRHVKFLPPLTDQYFKDMMRVSEFKNWDKFKKMIKLFLSIPLKIYLILIQLKATWGYERKYVSVFLLRDMYKCIYKLYYLSRVVVKVVSRLKKFVNKFVALVYYQLSFFWFTFNYAVY